MRDERNDSDLPFIPHPSSLIPSIITLLTDFGTADYYVAAMKGVILYANPEARIVDITHEIPPQDVRAAAFTLSAASTTFPAGTIHVAVVDPGVGSSRRPLLVSGGGHLFVGPDNGLFSHVLEREGSARAFHLTNQEFFRHPVSDTFHGRDVFAPVAAALSKGVGPEQLGVEIRDWVRLPNIRPVFLPDGTIEASIIHVDRFGNCVTSLTREHVSEEMLRRGLRLIVNGREVNSFRRYFSETDEPGGELFAIWGSAGFLEIAAFGDSAARLLDARPGQGIKGMRAEG